MKSNKNYDCPTSRGNRRLGLILTTTAAADDFVSIRESNEIPLIVNLPYCLQQLRRADDDFDDVRDASTVPYYRSEHTTSHTHMSVRTAPVLYTVVL